MPETGHAQHIPPAVAAAHRHRVQIAGRLPDRPEHAEVTDGGADGPWVPLEQHHRAAHPGGVISVRQPDDPPANYGDIYRSLQRNLTPSSAQLFHSFNHMRTALDQIDRRSDAGERRDPGQRPEGRPPAEPLGDAADALTGKDRPDVADAVYPAAGRRDALLAP